MDTKCRIVTREGSRNTQKVDVRKLLPLYKLVCYTILPRLNMICGFFLYFSAPRKEQLTVVGKMLKEWGEECWGQLPRVNGLSHWLSSKESACNTGEGPGVRKIPWRRK